MGEPMVHYTLTEIRRVMKAHNDRHAEATAEIERLRANGEILDGHMEKVAFDYVRANKHLARMRPVIDAAKAWYENVASGLMYESMDVSDRLLSDAVRALVASEAKGEGDDLMLTKQEAQVLLPFADKVALGPFRGGSLIAKLEAIAAQGASDREAEGRPASPDAAHPASALFAEARASIALDKGDDRTRNVDDASGEEGR